MIMEIRFLRFMKALFVLLVQASHVVAANKEFGNASIICRERERQALLSLKQDFTDPFDALSSWASGENHTECCKWEGVRCNDRTGHVVQLDLQGYEIGGIINPSLVELHHLIHLDLSGNDFNLNHIPKFIGSLTNLKYLSLYHSQFQGKVPHELGRLSHLEHLDLNSNSLVGEFPTHLWNLSRLVHLDLGENLFTGTIPCSLGNLTSLQYLDLGVFSNDAPIKSLRSDLQWVSHLKSLKFLRLESVDLSSTYSWLQQLANLSHLQELYLSNSNLHDSVPSFPSSVTITSTTLAVVDLSDNNLTSSIHKSCLELCSLRDLDLSSNKLTGRLDEFIPTSRHCANKSLEVLSLSGNQFTGSVPNLSTFPSLRLVSLDHNSLNGTVSESIGDLPMLESFTVQHNSLQGVITEAHFSNLSKLTYLDLSFNALRVDVSGDWAPPFQLSFLCLASCKLGSHFPRWLRTQKNIELLDISSNAITDPIPNWFWDLSLSLRNLNLSHNQISGEIANLPVKFGHLVSMDLSSNMLYGRIPSFLSRTSRLDLSNNKFSEADLLICSNMTEYLSFLDLSDNQFAGKLPECGTRLQKLIFLSLANNNFSGNIPSSIGLLTNIQALHLGNNHFVGELPSSLKNCKEIRIFDAVQNKLSGPLPSWIGDGLRKLQILSLRSNMFHGRLPSSICHLSELHILDVSRNNFSGSIPKCLNRLAALVSQSTSNNTITYYFERTSNYTDSWQTTYSDSESLIWKGKEAKYKNTLGLVKSIDLSSNNLIGEIQKELMNLTGLISLNISRNKLSGEIPLAIGQLKLLDSLDLSRNQLSGGIPQQFSQLGFLGVLDLSYNNLSGEIPDVTKLQSFDASAYMGNPELCGPPLAKCPVKQTDQLDANEVEEKHDFIPGFYISMIFGFIVGFWGVCGSLILKKSWRYAYFKFFDDLYDKLYVTAAISMAKRIRATS